MVTSKPKAWTISLILVACLAAPTPAQDVSASSSTETSATTNGKQVYRWNNSTTTTDFNIELRGTIELSDNDTDIKSISDDGYLEISKTVFGSKRSILIESLGDGKMKKEYYEGRTKMPWQPNGQNWLGEILPELVRNSTIGAESRVKRFFGKGGTSAVLTEIDKLESDHVKAHYGKLLMKQPVPSGDYPRVVTKITGSMDSDHYITDFLSNNVQKFLQNKEATMAMFTAAREMDSDHYKAIVISEALKGREQSPESLRVALQAASEMDSDHYIAQVLTDLLKRDNLSDAALTELINTTKTLGSDHYRATVLTQALNKKGLSDAAHQRLLESVSEISSDHYITQVIVELMVNKLSDATMTDLLKVLPSVESDHYRTEIFGKLLKNQKLTDEQFGLVLEACGDMGSDHYKAIVLKEAFQKADTNSAIVQTLNSVNEIDSDHYATDVLVSVAPKVRNGSTEIKNAYRQATRQISSELYYGRALKALEE